MHRIIKSSIKRVKKEVKSLIIKSREKKETKAKDNPFLYDKGRDFVRELLILKLNKKKVPEVKKKNLLLKENLKALLTFIFKDFTTDQIENILKYLFGNLSKEERENALDEIIDYISKKEYGFLLKD
jgi:hypothetical protein